MADYKFHLSPEWEIVVTEEDLQNFGCFPYGRLVNSQTSRILLLKAALASEEARASKAEVGPNG